MGLSSSSGANRGARAALALALALLLAASCRREGPAVTALQIISTWTDVDVDQLQFTVTDEAGTALVNKQRRPAQAQPQPLESGADLYIYFADGLGGKPVHADVSALKDDRVVASGQVTTTLSAHSVVKVTLPLVAKPGAKIDGAPCGGAEDCDSHICTDGVCCATECTGTCRSCAVPGKQGTCALVPDGIKHAACADQGAETCGFDGTCDGLGACRHHPLGTRCAAGTCQDNNVTQAGACDGKGHCVTGPVVTCAPFNCDPAGPAPHCFDSCTDDTQCIAGRKCTQGSCGQKQPGASCSSDAECVSGFCTDGVCCGSRCDGACVSCKEVGAEGSCRPIAAGVKDPRGVCKDALAMTCGTSGSCDGAGGCAKYAAGTVCRAPSCMGGGTEIGAGRCDGDGKCIPGQSFACAPYRCNDKTGSCNASCTSAADCADGIDCMLAQKSCGTKGLGQACRAASDCTSNFCVDGVCCKDACQGPCHSCSLGQVPGVCTPTAAGRPDPRGICKDMGKASCDTDGTCCASGTCNNYAAGTSCSEGSCSASTNTRTFASMCDGNGECAAGAQSSCAPYRCNGTNCFVACGSPADCVAPATCVSGACVQPGLGAPCMKPGDCPAPYMCMGSTCQLKPVGATCSGNNECVAGHCTDGVCCEAASCGTCASCNTPEFIGFCHPLNCGSYACNAAKNSCFTTCQSDMQCSGAAHCRNQSTCSVN